MAMITRLPTTEISDDRQLNSVSSGLRTVAKRAAANPWALSVVSEPLEFAMAGQKTFYHGLGQIPARWALEDATVDVPTVFRVSWDTQKVVFEATAACTVVIRVAVD